MTMAWCFDDEASAESAAILNMLAKSKAIVPAIWPLEVTNVLLMAERKNRINNAAISTFIELISALPIAIDQGLATLFNTQIFNLMRKHNLSAYDAAYLELALRYSAPIASLDKQLVAAAKIEKVAML